MFGLIQICSLCSLSSVEKLPLSGCCFVTLRSPSSSACVKEDLCIYEDMCVHFGQMELEVQYFP